MNWDTYFINIAEQVKLKSKDKNTLVKIMRLYLPAITHFQEVLMMILMKDRKSLRSIFGLNMPKETQSIMQHELVYLH
jgi:hypothetical protein